MIMMAVMKKVFAIHFRLRNSHVKIAPWQKMHSWSGYFHTT